ncbi:aromatic acid exporter family protein [Virgibacillus doumboii]|uniref:aromatic acid exporter family protein n=1 Tax=Virgibacillus doumboii TaxID=2697503 RepID=UPI0013DEA766|nr:aromatic acid exporter family protein [Virgibacillus doumboii]
MKIGSRTIKTAIGTPISISIAQVLGVTNFVSAGILTILCIQPSRKRSVMSAWHRFLACIIASIFSIVFFEMIGYSPIVIGLMLLCFIPTTVLLKITPGIATSSVIILNLYSAEGISLTFLTEQFILIVVGVGIALLVNLYMPSLENQLKEKQNKLEENFQVILHEIALYIRDRNDKWAGKELSNCEQLLQEASNLVSLDKENHLLRSKHPYYDYFTMRRKQFDLLQKMLPLVSKLPNTDSISMQIADFFEDLSDNVHPGNTAIIYLDELEELRKTFDKEELPKTQEEFETRANLFRLLHEIEDYLILKKKFKASDVNERTNKKKTGKA